MERKQIYEKTLSYFLSPIKVYVEDPGVSEIMINGPHEIYVERRGKIEQVNNRAAAEEITSRKEGENLVPVYC